MRFLHVIPSTNPEHGGPIEGIKQLSIPLIELGVAIEIVCSDAPDSPWLGSARMPIHALGPAFLKYSYNPRLLPWLRRNTARFDAVIVNGIWQYPDFATWLALAGTRVPYFVFTHGMLDPWFKRTYPFKHFKKSLYWLAAEYRVLRDARAVIFTCEEERLLARQSFWPYRVNEAVTAYGTASAPGNREELAGHFLEAYPQLQGRRIVLFLSRIHEKKGCDLLLDAFATVANADERLHLLMAGPNQTSWATKLRAQAGRLGIADRITWPGMLTGDMKWGAYYAADVFCLPSHQENFGIVVAEALACGKPVLISNKVNIWREVEADGAGFVDEDTVDGTARNLRRWLAQDADSYAQMGDRARKCFATRYLIWRAAERLMGIIQEHIR